MVSKIPEKNIDKDEYIEFDVNKFIKFLYRNKYLILILYLLSFIPGIFIPYEIVKDKKISMGEINISLLNNNYSFDGNTYNFILEKINSVDPAEEIELINNKSNILKIYKDIFPNKKFNNINLYDNLLIRLKQKNLNENYINIQFKNTDVNKIEYFINSLIKNYKSQSLERRAEKFENILKKLKNINEINLPKNEKNSSISKKEIKKINIVKNYNSNLDNNNSLSSVKFIELGIATLPKKSWYEIDSRISVNKVNKIRIFLIFNFISIVFIILFAFLKERYFGPFESVEIIEKFLKINFLGDLSITKDDNKYKESLTLSNFRTGRKIFNNNLIIIKFGEENFKELEKLKTKISDYSNSNIVLSNNIYDYNKTDKIILVKNNKPIDFKDLQECKEKFKYIEIEILGWFIIN